MDGANGLLRGTISGVEVDTDEFKGKIDVDVKVNFTGTLDVGYNLPASAGGRLTQELTITSAGNSTAGNNSK